MAVERQDPGLPTNGVAWSVLVRDHSGRVVLEHDADWALPGASLGKLLLLVEVAERLATGELAPDELLRRSADDTVADSGLWHLMAADALPVVDLALLVGAVSDNLATNVLLRRVGLEAVAERGRRLGLSQTALHDRVRDGRGPADPPRLSTVTARELVSVMTRLPDQVRDWLAAGTDLSMVASAFGLDPLAHQDADRGWSLVNKTGTDAGVRGDAGLVTDTTTGRSVAYAAVASWAPDGPDRRDEVLAAMRRIGELVRQHLRATG